MAALLNVKQFVRFDEHGNLHVPNKLFVACQAYVQTPLLGDNSNRVATTEWVRAQLTNITGISFSETDPIWASDKTYYYTKLQSDARYLQSFTETDPTVPAWAKASVKPSYTFSELTSHPTTIAGYGITDIPTTLPASDVYAWAKAATKPSYAYSEITGLPTLFSGSYTDLSNKPTLFSGAYTDLTGKPSIPTNTNELTNGAGFITSYTETDPIWISEKANYALKTYVDTSISNLVASAPAALNTLNELALALGSDANFSTTITTLIGTKEPSITAGTTLQYWRGDKTWQTLPTYTLSGLGGEPTITGGTNLQYWRGDKTWQTLPIYTLSGLGGQPLDADLTAIAALSGTSGFLKKTAADTWSLDTSTYLTTTSASSTYEPIISTGTTAQYWRGDKTWVALPIYTLSGLGGVPTTRTLTINGTALDLSADRSWTIATYSLPTSSTTVLGGVKVDGTTITINGSGVISGVNTYSLPIASATILGGIKIGSGLSIDAGGVVSAAGTYSLPIASATVLGGIKVGTNLSIDANGVLSSTDTNTTYVNFTRTVAGLVPNPGGATTNKYLREDGTWVVPPDTDTDTNTTYSLSIPAATTKLRLTGSDATTSDITFTAGANVTITRSSASEFTIASSYTDTNTWNANTKTADGYVTAPGAVANKVWKTDASGNPGWRDDADTDTTYVAFTRTAAGLAPASGGTTGTTKYLREDGTWAVPPDTDTDTNTVTQIRREDADGSTGATTYRTGDIRLRQGANVTISEISAGIFQIASSYTDTNTWNANSKDVAGYVSAPGAVANKVWKTDASGNPGWRDDADTDTNTTYTAGAGLTLTGTSFSVTKTITASATADTIALRDGNGYLNAVAFYQTSSRDAKTNIVPFNRSALDLIKQVHVVSFNYKTDVINKHIGFIAEDTPEELSTRQKNVMDTNSTVGVLLKAIQELEVRIKQLESK